MTVFFDYQIFYLQNYGGISRYFYELAHALHQIEGCNPKIVAPYQNNGYLKNPADKDLILSLNPVIKKIGCNRFYNGQIAVSRLFAQRLIAGKKDTVLHETYYTNRFKVKVPRVITIHDMIYELINHHLPFEKQIILDKKRAIQEADCIIAVSENTRKDLLDLYPEVKHKTVVIHHGVDPSHHPHIHSYVHFRPFILHVGHRGGYKNFELLLRAYASQTNIHQESDLICFGGGASTKWEETFISTHGLHGKVKFMTGNDALLISLYKAAALLVYISSYEGFGMPVLEAMALSCPVLCANTSSLPEVAGNAALSIDPTNEAELMAGLNAILFDTSRRAKLINLGLERVSEFTWQKCAQKTLTSYKKLI